MIEFEYRAIKSNLGTAYVVAQSVEWSSLGFGHQIRIESLKRREIFIIETFES